MKIYDYEVPENTRELLTDSPPALPFFDEMNLQTTINSAGKNGQSSGDRHEKITESIIIGVAGAGQEISTRPFQLVTGRVWRGTAFGGVKGRSELPEYVERYLAGEFALNDFITHTMSLEKINEAFELMHEGKSIRSVIHFDHS